MTILKLSYKELLKSSSLRQKVTKMIVKGKIVVFPTDTVYGILANPTKKEVVEKIFRIKKRSPKNHLPLFIKNVVMARKFAQTNRKQERFLKKVWPGRVTLVLKRKKRKNLYGIAPTTIALRVPDFKPLNLLLEKLDIPLTATSSNISGKPLFNNITMMLKQFSKHRYKPDLVVDIGSLPKRKPSTIIDLTKKPPKILRV